MIRTYQLDIFADYHQFYLCDRDYDSDYGAIWSDPDGADRMLVGRRDMISVGTARNMDVPVTIEVHDTAPPADLDDWEQVIDGGVAIDSGVAIVFGCTDYQPDAFRMEMAPGDYSVRVSYAGLTDLSEDGLDGNDRYRLQLWPGTNRPIVVVKDRPR